MGNISSVWHQKQKVRARIFSACNNITSIAVGATFAIQCTWSEVCAGWMGKWSLVLFLTKCCHGRSLTIWLQNHASVHAEWRLFFAVIFATIIAFFSSAKSYMINCTQSTLGIRAVVRGGDGLWVQPPTQIMTKITDQSVQLVQFFHFTPPKGNDDVQCVCPFCVELHLQIKFLASWQRPWIGIKTSIGFLLHWRTQMGVKIE